MKTAHYGDDGRVASSELKFEKDIERPKHVERASSVDSGDPGNGSINTRGCAFYSMKKNPFLPPFSLEGDGIFLAELVHFQKSLL